VASLLICFVSFSKHKPADQPHGSVMMVQMDALRLFHGGANKRRIGE
jgi:hypothetical protein